MDFGSFVDQELGELRKRLADAAALAAEAAVQRTTAGFQPTLEKLRGDQLQIASDNERLTAENAAFAETTAALQHAIEQLRGNQSQATSEQERLSAENAALAEATTVLQYTIEQLRGDQSQATSEQERLSAENAALTRTNAAFQQTLEKFRADQTQIASDNERLSAENAALTWEKKELLENAQANHRSPLLDRLVRVFERIDRAASVPDVLAAVAEGFHGEFARVAVFEVREHQLEATADDGFDSSVGIAKVVAPLDTDSFLAYAARGRSVRLLTQETMAALPASPFGGQPSAAVTLPIAVRGDLLALIYADDEGASLPAGAGTDALKLAYLLQRHASLRIERLTIELKALTELRAYAQMLVDEVEYVYEADRSAEKPVDERLARLQDNLRCARQIFQQRVTVEGPAAESLLEDVVARTVAGKAGTPFGADLAATAGPRMDAQQETRA